jgi:hypothetical protein
MEFGEGTVRPAPDCHQKALCFLLLQKNKENDVRVESDFLSNDSGLSRHLFIT